MKRILFVILAVVLCVSLCACGQNKEEKIIEELESKSWKHSGGFSKFVYTFENGTFTEDIYNYDFNYKNYENTPRRSYSGSYWIDIEGNQGKITMSVFHVKERGEQFRQNTDEIYYNDLYFKYQNGFLQVFWDEEMTDELK